ncbi:MAG: Ig-like domain-containing protein [Coriobacteriia bacterium]|nr:Ig-like domain-containing protein [Coriobacteriia bacterium]
MSVTDQSKQTVAFTTDKPAHLRAGLSVGSRVLAALVAVLVFFVAQAAFGSFLPQSLSFFPQTAHAVSVQDIHPSGTEVSIGTSIIVANFATPMDTAQALSATDININGSPGTDLDLPAASWSTDGLTLTLPITNNLQRGAAYTVNIGGLLSDSGDPMLLSHTHMFMTEASPFEDDRPYLIKMSAGEEFTLALRDDGALWAWGRNNQGQLGLGSGTTQRLIPAQVPVPGGSSYYWTDVTAGYSHTLAIRNDGSLWAWGYNNNGQLGLSDTISRNVPTRVNATDSSGNPIEWKTVNSEYRSTLALCVDGTLWSWGYNSSYQLGLGHSDQITVPTLVCEDYEWIAIAQGYRSGFAIRADETLWAWGRNSEGQLGLGDTTPRTVPTQVIATGAGAPTAWKEVYSDYNSTLALCEDGTLWTWGDNKNGQLGLGDRNQRIAPTLVSSASSIPSTDISGDYWIAVSMGYENSFGIRDDGTLWAWGLNNSGQLGLGDNNYRTRPTLVSLEGIEDEGWTVVAAGVAHTLAARDDGSLWTWGQNNYGQLGKAVTTSGGQSALDGYSPWRVAPALMPTSSSNAFVPNIATTPHNGVANVTATQETVTVHFNRPMRTEAEFRGVITIDNGARVNVTAGTWTDSARGANTVFTAPLTLVSSDTLHTARVAGFVDDFLGWKPTNEMHPHTWTFTTGEIVIPLDSIEIATSSGAAGTGHTIALQADGSLWAWGANDSGQLGLGDTNPRTVPALISEAGVSGNRWISVVTGTDHTVALRDNGTLYAWGLGDGGRLGTGNATNQLTPTAIDAAGVSGASWVEVAAGSGHTMALRDNGTLYAWGLGGSGRLGTGNVANQSSPTAVSTAGVSGAEWTTISAGNVQSFAIRDNGTLWAWGANGSGRLGLGLNDVAARNTPTAVSTAGVSGAEWTTISAGDTHTVALRDNGAAYAWGWNGNGRLGVGPGDTAHRVGAPTAVSTAGVSGAEWTTISAGGVHTLAIRDDGTLWGWGGNGTGRLGLGNAGNQFVPAVVPTASVSGDDWVTISLGGVSGHTVAVRDDGTFWSWGTNVSGQLGKGVANPGGAGFGSGIGTNDWIPWRIAASLQPTNANNWTAANNATTPNNTATNVGLDTNSVVVRFDRPMVDSAELRGTIALDNSASSNVAAGAWSENNTTFTAPLSLSAADELHTVTVSGLFVDDFTSRSKVANEAYPWTWTFSTEGLFDSETIAFDERACSTCHFTENLRLEHQFVHVRGETSAGNTYDYGCQKCHGVAFTDVNKTSWSVQSQLATDNRTGEINEAGCLSCHTGTYATVHGGADGNRMLRSHEINTSADTGCSASGCHGPIQSASDTGFGFGVMDLASAHADFWIAANEGRVAFPAAVSDTMRDDNNPFGCGACHGKSYNDDNRLRTPIVTHLDGVAGGVTCSTCHVVPDGANPLEMTLHFSQRELVPGLATALGLEAAVTPARASQSALDFVEALSAQTRAELDVGADTGNRLEAGVLAQGHAHASSGSDCASCESSHSHDCCESSSHCGSCETTGTIPSILASSGLLDCHHENECCEDPWCETCPCSPAYIHVPPQELPLRPRPPVQGGDDDDSPGPPSAPGTPPAGGGTADVAEAGGTGDDPPTAGAAASTGNESRETTGTGPQTGEINNWYLQIAAFAISLAIFATVGLIVGRKKGKPSLPDVAS